MKENNYKDSKRIFKNASTTHFFSSIFFRGQEKKDVFTLYAFARVVDDLVDENQDLKAYNEFKLAYTNDLNSNISSNNQVITAFIELKKRRDFRDEWIEALFRSMEMDFENKRYENLIQLEEYMYGAAGVIGLMLCKILNIKSPAYEYAINLGNVAQLTNIIRDIKDDNLINRQYVPQEILQKCNIESLEKDYLIKNPEKLKLLIKELVQIAKEYLEKSRQGFTFIPLRFRSPIKTIRDMYIFTLNKIEKNPQIILIKKVKPGKIRVISRAFYNLINPF